MACNATGSCGEAAPGKRCADSYGSRHGISNSYVYSKQITHSSLEHLAFRGSTFYTVSEETLRFPSLSEIAALQQINALPVQCGQSCCKMANL